MGLSPSEVAEGYETACEKALNILPGEWVWPSLEVKGRCRGSKVNLCVLEHRLYT